jgi:hypothetical protein
MPISEALRPSRRVVVLAAGEIAHQPGHGLATPGDHHFIAGLHGVDQG